jgi:hypothetical protein
VEWLGWHATHGIHASATTWNLEKQTKAYHHLEKGRYLRELLPLSASLRNLAAAVFCLIKRMGVYGPK